MVLGMIRKLQIRFILLSMSALLFVLILLITGINIVNYRNVLSNADKILELLADNNGDFPLDQENAEFDLPEDMSPEVPYESRYFYVTLNNETVSAIQTEINHIASVDSLGAANYAVTAIRNNRPKGFVAAYRYMMRRRSDTTLIIFLDCGRKLLSFEYFLYASIVISLAGYFLVFLIIVFFSNRIIRPISEAYEKQKRFITDAGHEIKTPLTIITADADILEMEHGKSEWISDIKKQAGHLTALTNDLIYLARLEESKKTMMMVEFPVSDLVAETAASFQAIAQTQGKKFECAVSPALSLCGNEKAVAQLTSILLDNALKYSPEGGIVSVRLEKLNKSIRLSVSNTVKESVKKEDLNRLFERFYRPDASRNSGTGGYGIGLSVANAIVHSHNGKIQASAPDGKSLLITATFPMVQSMMQYITK